MSRIPVSVILANARIQVVTWPEGSDWYYASDDELGSGFRQNDGLVVDLARVA